MDWSHVRAEVQGGTAGLVGNGSHWEAREVRVELPAIVQAKLGGLKVPSVTLKDNQLSVGWARVPEAGSAVYGANQTPRRCC